MTVDDPIRRCTHCPASRTGCHARQLSALGGRCCPRCTHGAADPSGGVVIRRTPEHREDRRMNDTDCACPDTRELVLAALQGADPTPCPVHRPQREDVSGSTPGLNDPALVAALTAAVASGHGVDLPTAAA